MSPEPGLNFRNCHMGARPLEGVRHCATARAGSTDPFAPDPTAQGQLRCETNCLNSIKKWSLNILLIATGGARPWSENVAPVGRRNTRHPPISARWRNCCRRVPVAPEEAFGWIKTVAGQQKSKFRGRDRVGWAFTFAATAYNLVWLPKLMAGTT